MATVTEEDKFVDDLRLVCENMRSLDYTIQSRIIQWYAGMNTKVANDGTEYAAQREDQGVPGVVGTTVHSLMAIFVAFKAQMDATGVRDVIQAPCVRPLRVE